MFISYFADFHDWEVEGIVTQINRDYRFLRISRIGSQNEEKIVMLHTSSRHGVQRVEKPVGKAVILLVM